MANSEHLDLLESRINFMSLLKFMGIKPKRKLAMPSAIFANAKFQELLKKRRWGEEFIILNILEIDKYSLSLLPHKGRRLRG
jgi:hypothetical protein